MRAQNLYDRRAHWLMFFVVLRCFLHSKVSKISPRFFVVVVRKISCNWSESQIAIRGHAKHTHTHTKTNTLISLCVFVARATFASILLRNNLRQISKGKRAWISLARSLVEGKQTLMNFAHTRKKNTHTNVNFAWRRRAWESKQKVWTGRKFWLLLLSSEEKKQQQQQQHKHNSKKLVHDISLERSLAVCVCVFNWYARACESLI